MCYDPRAPAAHQSRAASSDPGYTITHAYRLNKSKNWATSQSVIGRFHRTLRNMIRRMASQLQQLIDNYHKNQHSVLRMAPEGGWAAAAS